jgi:hypothetical protein
VPQAGCDWLWNVAAAASPGDDNHIAASTKWWMPPRPKPDKLVANQSIGRLARWLE